VSVVVSSLVLEAEKTSVEVVSLQELVEMTTLVLEVVS
jgi:hypothetical protein